MVRLSIGLLFCVGALGQVAPPEREFDFWIGHWDVQNRILGADAGWRDAGMAVARIRPILGGRAILEEWDGQANGEHANVFGISVRHFNPQTLRWVIALNWPSAASASFSHMEGSFHHGRAEFFPRSAFDGKPPRATRFTFSDALADTVRWDMAQPTKDGGWRTTWVMEFSRTRSAADALRDGEPIRRPPQDCVCKAIEARQFDPFVGAWSGAGWQLHGTDGTDGSETRSDVQATLRVTSTSRGCATLCFLDVERKTPSGVVVERDFEAWAWHSQAKKWVARALDDSTPEFHILAGAFDEGGNGVFVRTDKDGKPLQPAGQVQRRSYVPSGDGKLVVRHEVSADGGETWVVQLAIEFAPAK